MLAFFVEPWLLLRLQGKPAHRVTAAALALVAVELLVCGWAPHPLAVVVAMVLAGPASGVACAFAQAALVEIERRTNSGKAGERVASRWALSGALGDVAAPALLVVVGSRWRAGYLVGAAVTAVLALVLLAKGNDAGASARCGRAGDGEARADAEHQEAPRFTLRELLASRRVLLAALAATACTFLDEIVLGVGALYLDERFALATSQRSLVVAAWTAAALAGAAAINVAVERAPTPRLLLISGGACGLAFASALCVGSPVVSAALLVIAALFSSWHWPLCQALALEAAADRPLLVSAAGALWQPLELAAPFLIAAVAGALGAPAAMALLLVQPVAMMVASCVLASPHGLDGQVGDPREVSCVASQEHGASSSGHHADGDVRGTFSRRPERPERLGSRRGEILGERDDTLAAEESSRDGKLLGGTGATRELVPRDGAELDLGLGARQLVEPLPFGSAPGERVDKEVGIEMDEH